MHLNNWPACHNLATLVTDHTHTHLPVSGVVSQDGKELGTKLLNSVGVFMRSEVVARLMGTSEGDRQRSPSVLLAFFLLTI